MKVTLKNKVERSYLTMFARAKGRSVGSLESILRPKPKTLEKLLLVRRLLKSGLPAYKAVRKAKLGWKNYYKYAPLIYSDSEIPILLPKGFIRDYEYRGMAVEERSIVVLDVVAKHETTNIIRRTLT